MTPVVLGDGVTLWGAAHEAPGGTEGFLRHFRRPQGGGIHLALFHGSESGWLAQQGADKMPHAPFDEAEIERAGLHHAFVGHYHRPRDAERYTYPGNPDPLTFGEEGERGVVIATLGADGVAERQRVRIATSEVHDRQLDLSACRGLQEARRLIADALQGSTGVARVTLDGDVAPDLELPLADLADAAPWMEAVVVRAGRLRVRYDLESIADEPTVRGQFVRDVNAAGLSEDQRRRVLVTGLRALDERDDLEVP